MFFAKLIVVVASALAVIGSTNTTGNFKEPTLVGTHKTPVGELTLWDGLANKPTGAAVTTPECGTTAVRCDTFNVPSEGPCVLLIEALDASASFEIGASTSALCLAGTAGQCCISWAHAVPALKIGDVIPAAEDILVHCVAAGGGKSGVSDNTKLQGVCTQVCLSNRPNGCTGV